MSTATRRVEQVTSHLSQFHKGIVQDEVVIITGSGQGIGREAALQFAQQGASVTVNDLDAAKASAVVSEIRAFGGKAIAVPGNIMDEDFPKRIVDATVKEFGKINHLILNAGFTNDKMIHTMEDSSFDLMYNVHNKAPFRLVRAAAPYFRVKDPSKRENRSVLTVSSQSGTHGMVGQINYATAKAGTLGMAKVIAKEWGPFGVRANTIAFGHIKTRLTAAKEAGDAVEIGGLKIAVGIPTGGKGGKEEQNIESLIPLGRYGEPGEAASAMLFLCSSMASYVSGQTLEVAGAKAI